MKPGVPRGEAEAAVTLLFRNEMIHGAQPLSEEGDAPAVSLVPVQSGLNGGARGKYSTPLFILMLAVGAGRGRVASLQFSESQVRG